MTRMQLVAAGVRGGLALVLAVCLLVTAAALVHCDPAPPPAPPCRWSLQQWTATEVSPGKDQRIVLGARAEGSCVVGLGVHVGARIDGLALPGSTTGAPAPSLSDLTTVQSLEGWALAWRPVVGPLSVAALAGVQRPIEHGTLGLGGATSTVGAGVRLDYAGAWAVAALVSRYAPSGPGARAVVSWEMPVRGAIRFAGSCGLGRDGSFCVAGPSVGVGQ